MIKKIFAVILFLTAAVPFCYCESITVDELIAQYSQATDIQRAQIESTYKYKTISVSGVIENVENWDIYDERNETKGRYYKVTT
ncbi:MAG: hypothetical protein PHW46_06665, partial [Candidatus Omnitrophica bacterium]|nr:hypothetical protein [Candidatus Omnitrophota bacterium]